MRASSTIGRFEPPDIISSLRRVLSVSVLGGDPSLQASASALKMHPRTLNRRLRERGTTFQRELGLARFQPRQPVPRKQQRLHDDDLQRARLRRSERVHTRLRTLVRDLANPMAPCSSERRSSGAVSAATHASDQLERSMTKTSQDRIDTFFILHAARADRWRAAADVADRWANGEGDRAAVKAALADVLIMEEFHAVPGREDHAGVGPAH